MNKISLVVTVDYEVFGNGSGCVESCVLGPARKILDIMNHYSAPLTLFADIPEFIAMETYKRPLVHEIKKQLVETQLSGGDVQLHIHPQWYRAHHLFDDRWQLDMSKWRIADQSTSVINHLIVASVDWLDALFKEHSIDYECYAFRAGGWCIQPSKELARILIENGLRVDSSVAPGHVFRDSNEWYDFSVYPRDPYWRFSDDVCVSEEPGIWEFPITTGTVSKWSHLATLLRSRGSKGLAQNCKGNYGGPSSKLKKVANRLEKLRRLGTVMLDISTLSVDQMKQLSEQWLEKYIKKNKKISLVAIGHTKNFSENSSRNFEKYLSWASANGIQFSTFKKVMKSVEYENG
ncbi:MAG: hypothetical protein OEZ47_13820 [Gammaproteobacteria bacterium]|nr:hypothetical protein [Gammaproteobacteria bacterium]